MTTANKMGKVQIDSNFYHLGDVKYFINHCNERMVTDIEVTRSEKVKDSKYGPQYYKTFIKTNVLNMGGHISEHRLIVTGLNEHNTELLHQYIAEFLAE
jgi:hypothetical protein